jgi:hypothetical protein
VYGRLLIRPWLPGIAAALYDDVSALLSWEQLSLAFTPTASGVAEIVFQTWASSASAGNVWVDDIDIVQAAPPVVHTQWRLQFTAAQSGTQVTIAEIAMRTTLGGSNACTGGTASTSTGTGENTVLDSDNTTGWSASPLPHWWKYTFAAPVDIVQYAITFAMYLPGQFSPKDWVLEHSDDGTTWTVADTRSGIAEWTGGEQRVYTLP